MKSRVVIVRGLSANGRLALSPSQRANLRRVVNTFDAAVERERAYWGSSSAEKTRAKGTALREINAGLQRNIAFREVHALSSGDFSRS